MLRSLGGRLALAGVGFAAYQIVEPHVWIELQDQVAPTMFAMASVLGVLAGFTATAVVFVAAANGPGIEQMRLNHGRRLTNALLSAVATLLISAVGLVSCGVFGNGWGAKGAASALLAAPIYDVLLVFAALRTAINSSGTPERSAQDPDTL